MVFVFSKLQLTHCNFIYWHVPLHWRHNDHDGVSNHQPRGCLLNRLFRCRSKKTSKLRPRHWPLCKWQYNLHQTWHISSLHLLLYNIHHRAIALEGVLEIYKHRKLKTTVKCTLIFIEIDLCCQLCVDTHPNMKLPRFGVMGNLKTCLKKRKRALKVNLQRWYFYQRSLLNVSTVADRC